MKLMRSTVPGVFVLLVSILGGTTSSIAQERFYGGIGLGAAKAPIHKDSLGISGATVSALSRRESGIGTKIFAGYQMNPVFAVEAGYVDLGQTSATRSMTLPSVGSIAKESRNNGWFVDLVGKVPIGASEFSVIGKVGRIASETSRNLTASGSVTPVAGVALASKDGESNWKYGAGMQYEISKTVAARGEVELYRKLGSEGSTDESDVGLFSVNLLIKFY